MSSTSANDGQSSAHRHVRGRLRPEHRRRRRAEPRRGRAAAAARGGAALRASPCASSSTDLTLVVNLLSPDGSRDDAVPLATTRDINVARPAEAAARRGRVSHLRRAALRDARLARPRASWPSSAYRREDVIAACASRTCRSRRARSGSRRRRTGQQFQYALRHEGPAHAAETSSRRSCVRARPRRLGPAARRRGARGARRAELQRRSARLDGQPDDQPRRLPAAERERARRRRPPCAPRWTRIAAAHSRRASSTRSSTTRRASSTESISRSADDAVRGDAAGLPGRVRLPADWRATLIPAITIPVSLIGTFAAAARARASRSTRSRSSGWCWRSGWSWTTRSWWSRTSRACSRSAASRRARRRGRRWARSPAPIVAIDAGADGGVRAGRVPARHDGRAATGSSRSRSRCSVAISRAERAHALARAVRAAAAPEGEHKKPLLRAPSTAASRASPLSTSGVGALACSQRRPLVLGAVRRAGRR